MSSAHDLSRALIEHAVGRLAFRRLEQGGDPHLTLRSPDQSAEVGFVDVYAGDREHGIDRLLHIWIGMPGARMDTNLIWLFAREDSLAPHYHAQAIHMPNERYVYNFDLMPRVDLALHPAYWHEVFDPLSAEHEKATRDKARAQTRLPMPPTTAIYMSPWGLAALGAPKEELEAAWPLCEAYLDRSLDLAKTMRFSCDDRAHVSARHAALIEAHTSDAIDPRGWAGIERAVGAESKERIKQLMREPLT
jgi:hypothetical protein